MSREEKVRSAMMSGEDKGGTGYRESRGDRGGGEVTGSFPKGHKKTSPNGRRGFFNLRKRVKTHAHNNNQNETQGNNNPKNNVANISKMRRAVYLFSQKKVINFIFFSLLIRVFAV